METAPYKNIAAYKFVALAGLAERREALRELGAHLGLKGTVLLSPEGINVVASGAAACIDEFVGSLRVDEALSDLEIKESPSESHSFTRWLVKLKKEIIVFGKPEIEPERYTSARIKPATLKEWFDSGKSFRLLDVRNNYEIEQGTFTSAEPINLDHFRDFPAAAAELPADLRDQPVVTFCTGGVRCEKAGPFLESIGFTNVYQLDGGILQYFEDVGGDHYTGDCFVFDKRIAVTPELVPAGKVMCFACQQVLAEEDLASGQYVPAESCPHCFKPADPVDEETLSEHARKCRDSTTPLPGSVPYTSRRPIRVRGRADGLTVAEFLATIGSPEHVDWAASLEAGRISRREIELAADDVVRGGERLIHTTPDHTEPDVSNAVEWLYEDADLIALNKPAPLPVHPSGRFNRNTLAHFLRQVYPDRLRPAHRLDASTTGVQLFARTAVSAKRVQDQFASGTVGKTYLARVHGQPSLSFASSARISSQPVDGIRTIDDDGLAAHTEFTVLACPGDGTTLIRAIPHTGRTNQIRLHLWDLGFPIVGDPVYRQHRGLAEGAAQIGDQTMCLHAHKLKLVHPRTEQRLELVAPAPPWAEAVAAAQ